MMVLHKLTVKRILVPPAIASRVKTMERPRHIGPNFLQMIFIVFSEWVKLCCC